MTADGVKYSWYADDFTGATDTLATLAERGQKAFLFLSIPDPSSLSAVGPLDAIGIAGSARAMSNDGIKTELETVGHFLRQRGARLVHYKCCSTFDSSRQVGNLATAVGALLPHVDHAVVPVVGGQPSLGRYCAFSNLFAAERDNLYRLDRHPTMSRHPVTPMHEADLSRHLALLGMNETATVTWLELERGATDRWRKLSHQSSPVCVVFDVLNDSHLAIVGGLLREATAHRSMVVLGASSVAEAYFPRPEHHEPAAPADPIAGPVLALAGSLSPNTRSQVAAAQSFVKLPITPASAGKCEDRARLVERAAGLLRQDNHVLFFTAPPDGALPEQANSGFADQCGAMIDDILQRVPVRRLAIAGGDTSSRVTQSIGVWGLDYHSRASRGVTVCTTRSKDPDRDGMQLMLKGGQMGNEDLFDEFAAAGEFKP